MSEPRVIVLCASRFALPALQQLAFFKQLVAVVIPVHCKEMIEITKVLLTGASVPVVTVSGKTFEKKIAETIKIHSVDTGLMLSFIYKLPPSVYQLPVKGFFNVHAGMLPAYRGPDPVFQQIRNREKNAGVTLHKVDEDFNTGPVVVSEQLRLEPEDTHGMLIEKLAYPAARLTGTLLKLLSFDIAIPSRQQDETKARYYPKQLQADAIINWHVMNAASIVALINACNPWNNGAMTKLNNKILRLMEATLVESLTTPGQPPGTIINIDEKGLVVAALNNEALSIQVFYSDEGFLHAKRLNKFGVVPGARFTNA